MRRIVAAALVFPAVAFFSWTAHASMIVKSNIEGLAGRAKLIVVATGVDENVTSKGKAIPGAAKVAGKTLKTESIATSKLKIEKVIADRTSRGLKVGNEIEFSYFRGINTAKGLIRPSVRMRSIKPDEKVVIFFGEHNGKLFVLGVDQGRFDVVKGMVTNPYMKTTMFKGMKVSSPGVSKALKAGNVNVGKPPAAMELDDFEKMVESLSGDEGGTAR
jgi:hypothetical protein